MILQVSVFGLWCYFFFWILFRNSKDKVASKLVLYYREVVAFTQDQLNSLTMQPAEWIANENKSDLSSNQISCKRVVDDLRSHL